MKCKKNRLTSDVLYSHYQVLYTWCNCLLCSFIRRVAEKAYTTIATNTGCVQSDEAALSWVIESRQLLPVPWVHRPWWWGLWLTELSVSHARPLCSKAFPNDAISSQWLQITGSTNRNLSITEGWMHHHPFPAQRDLTVSPQVRLQWKPTPLCFRSFLPQDQGDATQRRTLVHFTFGALHTWPRTPLYKANRPLAY